MDEKHKAFKIEKLDSISPTFCAAKWLTSDIYLHTGVTSSCNLPQPGKIDLRSLDSNVLTIHNTQEKIHQRQMMLEGKQPDKCHSCWSLENQNADTSSHRIILSYGLRHRDFTQLDLRDTVVPEMITLMLDNLCNFTCMYCDPTQSSSWASDLQVNGAFSQIKHDPRKTYLRLGTKDRLTEDQKQYFTLKVKQMIFDNIAAIKSLRFLGGEPTINPDFWHWIDELATKQTDHLSLQIVTNLSFIDRIHRFLDLKPRYKSIRLMISIDGTHKSAEFIRQGLDWSQFENNVLTLLSFGNFKITFIGTINVLSIDVITSLLDWLLPLMEKYPDRIDYESAIVTAPVFQSLHILPTRLKHVYLHKLASWKINNSYRYPSDSQLASSIDRLITALSTATEENAFLQQDFRYFVTEFERRHKLSIDGAFSQPLVDFIRHS